MTVCEHAHESLELWLGKPFKPFSCSICGWQSGKTKAAFLNKKNMHASLDEEERRQIELDHARDHFWKTLFKLPVFADPIGMMAHIPDGLHLVNLNLFKRFWRSTIYLKLNDDMQLVVEDFMRKAGYPIKIRSDDPNLANAFIGRDCKKFVAEMEHLLPHLLHVANCPASAGAAATAATVEAHPPDEDDDDEIDDEFEPTSDKVEAEKALHPEMMQHTEDWDAFCTLALDAMRPFDPARGDTAALYRGERAVEHFNAVVEVVRA